MRRLTVFAFLLVVLCASVVAAQTASAAGSWDGTLKSPQGEFPIHLTLKQDGDKVSGTVKGRAGDLPISGTASGNDVKLSYTIQYQNTDMVITLTGAMDAVSMKGSADFGGMAQGEFNAKRATEGASTAAAPSAPAGSNITGEWAFQVETSQGAGTPSFTFKQDGENLTGQYKGAFGEAPLTGTLKGDKVTFTIKISAQGQELSITYTGTLEKDGTMKGTAELGEVGSATWTAKRK